MTHEEEVRRGKEAARIVGSKMYKEAMQEIKDALIQQWMMTPVKDTELRERIWAIYVAHEKFEEILKSVMDTGKMAAIQLQPL